MDEEKETTILFLCQCSDGCLRFQDAVEREGCHLVLARDVEQAEWILLFPRAFDAVLIHHSSIAEGNIIACGLKLISPNIPMLLITDQWPNSEACPAGVDAVCHTSSLSRRASRDIVRFVRRLNDEKSRTIADESQYSQSQFAARRPTYLN